jgi:hypothetical protein
VHHGAILGDPDRRLVRKDARAAGIIAPIGNHSFRATGLMEYLANGGTLEHAQTMALSAMTEPDIPSTCSDNKLTPRLVG